MPTAGNTARYGAVAFDLLTGLLDSWTLWDRAAGGRALGRAWRHAYLTLTYEAGNYVEYESLVQQAAVVAGAPADAASRLIETWDALEPWPDAISVLGELSEAVPLAVVTNCSNALAARAMARLRSIPFVACVTAEQVGAYKPDPRTYQTMLRQVGTSAANTLFVAGSPFDITGAGRAGMPVYWHNHAGLVASDRSQWPADVVAEERSLAPLIQHVLREPRD